MNSDSSNTDSNTTDDEAGTDPQSPTPPPSMEKADTANGEGDPEAD